MGEIAHTTLKRRQSIRRRRAAAATLSTASLVLGLLILAQPAQAANPLIGGGPEARSTIQKLPVQEQQAVSKSLGLSLEQVSDQFDGQMQFSNAVAQIESRDQKYASSKWQKSATSKGWIEFAGLPSTDSLNVLRDLPFQVEVRTGALASASQIQSAVEAAHQQVLRSPGVLDANTWYDLDLKSIRTDYKTADIPFARSAPAPSIAKNSFGIPVISKVNSSAGSTPQVARGGVGITGCTTAFAATKGGLRGVLTADHCPKEGGYVEKSGPTQFNSGHQGGYGDFQFQTTNDSISGSIAVNYEGTSLMAITGQAIAAAGNTVCNYGKTRQNWTCAVVQNTSICAGNMCRLVQTDRQITYGGDSGGPWFAGNRALGILMGLVDNKSTYSRIGNAEAILGVTLKLT